MQPEPGPEPRAAFCFIMGQAQFGGMFICFPVNVKVSLEGVQNTCLLVGLCFIFSVLRSGRDFPRQLLLSGKPGPSLGLVMSFWL